MPEFLRVRRRIESDYALHKLWDPGFVLEPCAFLLQGQFERRICHGWIRRHYLLYLPSCHSGPLCWRTLNVGVRLRRSLCAALFSVSPAPAFALSLVRFAVVLARTRREPQTAIRV